MDSLLITVVVVVIAALSNWLQRRAQAAQEQEDGRPGDASPSPRPSHPGSPPLPPASPIPTLESRLERELRRLLEGRPPAAPPAIPSSSPPRTARPPEPRPVLHVPAPQRLPPKPLRPAPRPRLPSSPTFLKPSEPASALERVQHLHDNVARHMHTVDAQTEKHNASGLRWGRKASLPAYAIIAATRHPDGAREAFVASLVFGPPKSLES